MNTPSSAHAATVLALTGALAVAGCRDGSPAPRRVAPSSSAPSPGSIAPLASATAASPQSAAAAPSTAPPSPAPAAGAWPFDKDTEGAPPAGFSLGRTGKGREGKWSVIADATAPSGAHVLAQLDADTTDLRYPVAFANEPTLADVDLSVRCKAVSGKVDQACGLVFRLKDANNYYVTRANALEDNIRLYTVKDGRRRQLASFDGKVTANVWHTYRVVATGDHVEVHWDGARVLDHHDKTFPDAGKVGVWTKADSVTYFDDLVVKAP